MLPHQWVLEKCVFSETSTYSRRRSSDTGYSSFQANTLSAVFPQLRNARVGVETPEMEKRTLLWGSSGTRKWCNLHLQSVKYTDLTRFEYWANTLGKHQSIRSIVGSSSVGQSKVLCYWKWDQRREPRKGNWYSNAVESSHKVLPLSAHVFVLFLHFSHFSRLHQMPLQQHKHVAWVYVISFFTYYGIRRVPHPITLCGTNPLPSKI